MTAFRKWHISAVFMIELQLMVDHIELTPILCFSDISPLFLTFIFDFSGSNAMHWHSEIYNYLIWHAPIRLCAKYQSYPPPQDVK